MLRKDTCLRTLEEFEKYTHIIREEFDACFYTKLKNLPNSFILEKAIKGVKGLDHYFYSYFFNALIVSAEKEPLR